MKNVHDIGVFIIRIILIGIINNRRCWRSTSKTSPTRQLPSIWRLATTSGDPKRLPKVHTCCQFQAVQWESSRAGAEKPPRPGAIQMWTPNKMQMNIQIQKRKCDRVQYQDIFYQIASTHEQASSSFTFGKDLIKHNLVVFRSGEGALQVWSNF